MKYVLKAVSDTYQRITSKKIDKNTISLIYYLDKDFLTQIERFSDKPLIQITVISNIEPIINDDFNYKDNKESDQESKPKIINILKNRLAEIKDFSVSLSLLIVEKYNTLIEQLIFSALNIYMTNKKK